MQTTLDETIYRFEAAHQAAENPQIADFLPATGGGTVLVELTHIDLEYRLKRGEAVRVENYLSAFPQISDEASIVELIVAEWNLRSRSEPVSITDFTERFPDHAATLNQKLKPSRESGSVILRCPDCRTRVPLSHDSELAGISCSSCGSQIRLAAEALSPGQTLAQFELRELVGTGAFGTVWKALDTELDRYVAIKVPRHKLDGDEADSFFREARATAGLRHPNIVTTYEVGRADQHVYIASDFIEGRTLAEVLEHERFAHREAARLCLAICGALECAHAADVVHRDLKPSNIMIDPNGNPVVMDFGLAKRATGEVTMTIDGRILGTPAFMSPEQAAGEAHSADQRSDIYSLGVILFALLTNEVPFRGGVQMVLHQVREAEPPSPRTLESRVPRDLETICLKCLEKHPHRRFETARQLANELQRFLSGEPIHSRPISRFERAARWARRKPVLAMLSGLLATIAIAAPLIAFNQARLRQAAERSQRQLGNAVEELRDENDRATAAEGRTAEANRQLEQALAESRRQFEHAQMATYAAHLQAVRSEFEAGNYGRAIGLLDRCNPKLRDWEFGYVRALCERAIRKTHLGLANDVLFVRRLDNASDGQPQTVIVENVGSHVCLRDASGRLLNKLRVEELSRPAVVAISASERENLVLCLDRNGLLTQWDMTTGNRVRFFHIDGIKVDRLLQNRSGHGLAVHPTEPTVAVSAGKSGKILLVNLEDGSPVETGNAKMPSWYQRDDYASELRFTPGGGRLLAFGKSGMSVHMPGSSYSDRRAAPDGQNAVAFADDGTMFYQWQLCGLDDAARSSRPQMKCQLQESGPATTLQDLVAARKAGRRIVRRLPDSEPVSTVAFSPDGGYFATATRKGRLHIWERSEDSMLRRLTMPGRVQQLGWDSESTLLARTDHELVSLNIEALTKGIDATPKGTSFLTTTSGLASVARDLFRKTISLRPTPDSDPIALISTLVDQFEPPVFAASGRYIAVPPAYKQPRQLSIFETATGRFHRGIDLDPNPRLRTKITAIPESTNIAMSDGYSVLVYDVESGQQLSTWPIPVEPKRKGSMLQIAKLVPIPKTEMLCISVAYHGLVILDLQTGQKLAELQNRDIWDVASSPDGRLALGLRNHVEIRDPQLSLIRNLPSDFERRVLTVTFSPSGNRIFAAGEERILRGYDAKTGVNVLTESIETGSPSLGLMHLHWQGTTLLGQSGGTEYRLNSTP